MSCAHISGEKNGKVPSVWLVSPEAVRGGYWSMQQTSAVRGLEVPETHRRLCDVLFEENRNSKIRNLEVTLAMVRGKEGEGRATWKSTRRLSGFRSLAEIRLDRK
jgi:hypothetical protein